MVPARIEQFWNGRGPAALWGTKLRSLNALSRELMSPGLGGCARWPRTLSTMSMNPPLVLSFATLNDFLY